jgi:lipopolysaccharide biosynthesis glycosyltransferase
MDLPTPPNGANVAASKACICYISDHGYLFPSLMSAIQVRKQFSAGNADIIMYYVGKPSEKSEVFRSIYEEHGIQFVTVSHDTIDNKHIMFARLFLDRFVDPKYESIVYVDGDTQIVGDLDPLLKVQLPAGKFLAARDPMALAIDWNNRESSRQRTYFKSIGLPLDQARQYFNSGVLRLDRKSWISISADALRAADLRKETFKFPDQDALNLVAGSDCLTMSFKWNFPVFFLNIGVAETIRPRVYHFMSNPRPWQGPFEPWGRKWHTTYRDLVQQYPKLAPYVQTLSAPKYLKYFFQQHYKKGIENVVWRCQEIFEKISAIESSAIV